MRSRLLVPGKLYRFLCSDHFLFKHPRIEAALGRVGTIKRNALVMYVTKAKYRGYNDGCATNKCMMVKVVSGDVVGWVAIIYLPPFRPESYFIQVNNNEISST